MTFKLPENIATRAIAILGAGTLGRRIALMLATRGAEVRLYARTAATRDAGVAFAKEQLPAVLPTLPGSKAGTIVGVDDMAAALKNAWLVVESVPENLELKKDTFKRVDALSESDAILPSNSSSYSSSDFADSVKNPARLLNTHFLMPPGITPVELMSCGQTDPAVIQLLVDVLPGYGLTPYVVQRESMGFIFNRIWAAIKRESLTVVAEGVSTPTDVDEMWKLNMGSKSGPFRLMDAVGLDIVLEIENHYLNSFPNLPTTARDFVKRYVDAGKIGRKSGEGFYNDYLAKRHPNFDGVSEPKARAA